MRLSPAASACARGVTTALVAMTALAGCSSSSRLEGPSWNLTGGKGATPIPPRPVYAQPPQPAAVPAPERTVPVYRGGRDPVSGRAPTWGAPPHGLSTAPPPPWPQQQTLPAYAPPPAYHPPIDRAPTVPSAEQPPRPARSAGSQARTIEVRPGQSLAMIAADHRVSIAALMQANGLRDAYVIPGQSLVIPPR